MENTMKQSKNTTALLARYPTFRDWVVNNLTEAQLNELCHAERGSLYFGPGHPLNDQKFSAGLFRAYRSNVISQLKYQFTSFDDFLTTRGQRATWDETWHTSVVWAIAFMTLECPEVYQEISNAVKAASDDDVDDFD
jgi:hypothetical protein